MALSKSLQKGQAPISCQLCEEGGTIHWRCEQCILLICDKCKKLHLKITKDHKIVDIRSVLIPQKCQVCNTETKLNAKCEDCQLFLCQSCHNGHRIIPATKAHKISVVEDENRAQGDVQSDRRIGFTVLKQYQVNTKYIHYLTVSDDGSLWVGDRTLKKVLHIKLTDDRVTVLSTFDIYPHSLAILPSGLPLVSNNNGQLKVLNEMTGQISDSRFSIDNSWLVNCVHVTKDKNLFLGEWDGEQGVVILMNNDGKPLMKYDKDKDKQLLTCPAGITQTQNGNIFIIDRYGDRRRARLIVIMPDSGDIIYHYGHPDINSDQKPFFSRFIVVTPKDNVLTIDIHTNNIYILNNKGILVSFYDPQNIRISEPRSLAISRTDTLYIGCAGVSKDGEDPKAPLYELEYSGV